MNRQTNDLNGIARIVVGSWRLSTLIDYAAAAPFPIGFWETAGALEDSSNGIWRWPMTLRNWRSAVSGRVVLASLPSGTIYLLLSFLGYVPST
jgi:hypothetical protein